MGAGGRAGGRSRRRTGGRPVGRMGAGAGGRAGDPRSGSRAVVWTLVEAAFPRRRESCAPTPLYGCGRRSSSGPQADPSPASAIARHVRAPSGSAHRGAPSPYLPCTCCFGSIGRGFCHGQHASLAQLDHDLCVWVRRPKTCNASPTKCVDVLPSLALGSRIKSVLNRGSGLRFQKATKPLLQGRPPSPKRPQWRC